MRAAVVRTFGGPEAVEIADVEVPEPGAGQVRIKVAAAALNPVDAGRRSGFMGDMFGSLPLGSDVAGTIDATGPDAQWSVGDKVVALAVGTHAEYVIVDADAVAKAPATADEVQAATLALNALTAAQALDLLELTAGQSLLVTGAAGAVGGYAVQLAAHRGVTVTALARANDEELVRSLGATHVAGAGEADFDAVLDAGALGEPALARVRDNGTYVGVHPGAAPASVRGVRTDAVETRPDGARLAELVQLADQGVLTLRVAETYPLAEAAKAHARLAEGGLRGRLVLVP
ncbi:NADP-dependent oxidoreductase [Streptomyces sp. NBC_00582]|uniref:NADP-dependent oxidoreductase n=1 Tax=Streptomyces sp. NBC_00582 TaxID=2975783 RepID=UPI001062CC3D|nr:NADP-dependent oxidoreductase [Streptomyces sp. NBC_00582]WUB66040.1 NADP-dependent oxidoreductase [Streptomyces sp. NBC_00582]